MAFENILNGRIGDVKADVGQSPLNPVAAPRGILLGESQNQVDDLLPDLRATDCFPMLAAVPLLGDQFSMPPQNRIWREQRAIFLQQLATQDLALDGRSPALIVIEQDPFLAELLFEYLVCLLKDWTGFMPAPASS